MGMRGTKSGLVEIVDKWGHGKGPRGEWYRTPCVTVSDDGDGHETAW